MVGRTRSNSSNQFVLCHHAKPSHCPYIPTPTETWTTIFIAASTTFPMKHVRNEARNTARDAVESSTLVLSSRTTLGFLLRLLVFPRA